MLDLSKPVQTRDGRSVRILCTDRLGFKTPIIGLINQNSQETVYMWTKGGRSHFDNLKEESNYDLVNVKEKKSGWVNIYPPKANGCIAAMGLAIWSSKDQAIEYADKSLLLDTIEIHWEE